MLILGCTKLGGAKGDGTTRGTCKETTHKCVYTGQCLGNQCFSSLKRMFYNDKTILLLLILLLLLVVLLAQRLLIAGCTKVGGAIGDGTTRGTCTDISHKCVYTGQCLGN